LKTKWGTTPYFASLMDKDDPNCPIRKQVIPSMKEQVNEYGMENYLIWKENRATEEVRPDSIARQYHDRVAFTVVQDCGNYCRHCFRKELVVDQNLQLNFDVDEGLAWIAEHPEIRDVLVTGGDPLLLSDDKLEYLINKLREITTHRNDSHRLPASNSSTAACHRRFDKCYRRLPQSSSLDQ
jgi:lysine 2,3-aminomutase